MIRLLSALRPRPAKPKPTPGEIAEARKFPGGFIYRLGTGVDPASDLPMDGVIGWWRVEPDGAIRTPFERNAQYDATRWPLPRRAS